MRAGCFLHAGRRGTQRQIRAARHRRAHHRAYRRPRLFGCPSRRRGVEQPRKAPRRQAGPARDRIRVAEPVGRNRAIRRHKAEQIEENLGAVELHRTLDEHTLAELRRIGHEQHHDHAMPGATTVLLFALATFLLTVSPGPGVLYVTARSLAQGRRAGFASMFGIEFGEWCDRRRGDRRRRSPLHFGDSVGCAALRRGGLPRLPRHSALATGRRGDGAAARAARKDLPPGFRDAAAQPEGGGVFIAFLPSS